MKLLHYCRTCSHWHTEDECPQCIGHPESIVLIIAGCALGAALWCLLWILL